jgi:hypothetical protein
MELAQRVYDATVIPRTVRVGDKPSFYLTSNIFKGLNV